MLGAIVLVISLLVAGDVAVAATGLPVPGAVLGMLALAGLCASHESLRVEAARLFDGLIPYAPMLFVPAAVGVLANLDVIASAWLPIVSAITLSTAAALIVTGRVFQALLHHLERRAARSG